MIRFVGIDQLLTLESRFAAEGANRAERALGLVRDAALVVDDGGAVAWVGPEDRLPTALVGNGESVDLRGASVVPGFVECHTHIVFGGLRERDFEERCSGVSYEAIAARGGGIQTTVRATREASEQELADGAMGRLDELLAHGVTTVEIKSGYGLEPETELKMLRVVRRLAASHPVRVVPTFLGAHTVPTAFGVTRERYVDQVIRDMLPEVARQDLAEFCDVFCEQGAFTPDETRRILCAAADLGLGLKVHAEQLTHQGATALAVSLGATSADHLEHIDPDDIAGLANSRTVAVLLPGASLFLGAKRWPPARALLDAGAEVALSTDYNPGSSNTAHLPLMTTLGCTVLGMAPHETLRSITRAAARAVGREETAGALLPGRPADFVVLRIPAGKMAHVHLPYQMGQNPTEQVWIGGRRAFQRGPDEHRLDSQTPAGA